MKNNTYSKLRQMAVSAVMSMAIGMCAFSAVTPTTKWGDIPPNDYVTNVADKVGIALGSNYTPIESFLTVSNKVADIEEALDEIMSGGEGGVGEEELGGKKIAMFIIDLNYRVMGNTSLETNT